MKTHKTVTITAVDLERFHACTRGLDTFMCFLPATISSDPEQNIDLAIDIAEMKRAHDDGWCDLGWLASAAAKSSWHPWPDSFNFDNEPGNPDWDPYVVAQFLAHAADAILTKKGL